MIRRTWLLIVIILSLFAPIIAKERKLNPYQDYIFIILHGINDSRFSFNGESPEFSENTKKARDVLHYLTDDLGIPEPYVKLYTYTQNRGSNIQNAKELGMAGYTPPYGQNQLGGAGLDAVQGLGAALNLLDIKDLATIGSIAAISSTLYSTAPKIEYNPQYFRDEFSSYHPSMLQHYPTGIQTGNSFLEQAVIDFKEDYFNSDLNFDFVKQRKIYEERQDIPDSIVPKKFIFLGHSMSNLSMRLYVYSNELAEKGKFFDKGFYKDNVEKIVFMAPPLEGSEMAIGSLALPFLKKLQLAGIAKDLNPIDRIKNSTKYAAVMDPNGNELPSARDRSLSMEEESAQYMMKSWNQMKDPWLLIKDPLWPLTLGGPLMSNALRLYRYPKAKQYIASYLGLTDPPSALFYPGTWEMIPDKIRLELSGVGGGELELYKLGSDISLHGTKMGEVVHELKNVTKSPGKQEPMYSIVYGTGLPSLSISDSLQMVVGGLVKGSLNSSFGDGFANWGLMTSPRFQSLNASGKLMNYVFSGAGMLAYTADGDLPVPAWSARGENTKAMKNARRYEYRFSAKSIEDFQSKTMLPMMAAADGLACMLAMPPFNVPLDVGMPALRTAVLSSVIWNFTSNLEEYSQYLQAHGDVVAQRQLITPALEEAPVIDLSDTDYLSRQNIKWSGVYGVTRNAAVVSQNKDLRPFLILGDRYGVGLPSLNVEPNPDGAEITLFNGQKIKGSVMTLSDDEIMIRGVVKELLPHQLQTFEYSNNFSGWDSLKTTLKPDGRFELGPIPLAEGHNVIAFRAKNRAGYTSNQILKILKTGITLQPVLDEVFPVEGSVTRNPRPRIALVYQNMKYTDLAEGVARRDVPGDPINTTAGNKIVADSLMIAKAVGSESVTGAMVTPELINLATQTQVLRNKLNRLEVSYLPTRNLDDGVYQVTVKAHDAYNTSSFIRYTFSVDQTPPTVSILPIVPLNPDTASSAIVVQTQSSDGVNIVIPKTVTTIRNAQNSTIYSATTGTTNTGIGLTSIVPTSSAFPDGMYTITVEMTDVAGNVGSVTTNEEKEVMG